jgi:CheY-like chemotaxis protein
VIQDEKLIVNGSSSEIQNALLNLIINARDSIKLNGTITVSCQAKTLDEAFCGKMAAFDVSPGNFVCITISDDGCGMDDDTLQKVFEPFYSTKEERGTGLGLSSVYKTILEHDGCLDIQSMEGYGTQVFLYFKKEDMQSIRPKKSNNNDLNLKNIHAFVIDDVNSTLVSIAASLEEYGATVDCFTDPQRALDEFNVKSSDIDIVIVDQVMPGTSGYFLIQEMQEVKPDLKSIIVTGLCDQTKVEGLRKRGAFVVTKPFHLHAFVSAVSDCLKK